MYCQLILLLIKISACTVYFGLSECILSIPHLEHVLLLQKKGEKQFEANVGLCRHLNAKLVSLLQIFDQHC